MVETQLKIIKSIIKDTSQTTTFDESILVESISGKLISDLDKYYHSKGKIAEISNEQMER